MMPPRSPFRFETHAIHFVVLSRRAGRARGGPLAYRPFPEWWYLRFLLPAVVVSIVLAMSAAGALAGRIRGRTAPFVTAVAVVAIATFTAGRPETREAFGLARER